MRFAGGRVRREGVPSAPDRRGERSRLAPERRPRPVRTVATRRPTSRAFDLPLADARVPRRGRHRRGDVRVQVPGSRWRIRAEIFERRPRARADLDRRGSVRADRRVGTSAGPRARRKVWTTTTTRRRRFIFRRRRRRRRVGRGRGMADRRQRGARASRRVRALVRRRRFASPSLRGARHRPRQCPGRGSRVRGARPVPGRRRGG